MANAPKQSPIDILTKLGDLVAKLCTDQRWAILIAVLAWIFHPIGGLITTLLIISIYAHNRRTPGEPLTPHVQLDEPYQSKFLVLVGLFLVVIGAYWLVRYWVPELPWAVVLIPLGLLLILLGITRRDQHGT